MIMMLTMYLGRLDDNRRFWRRPTHTYIHVHMEQREVEALLTHINRQYYVSPSTASTGDRMPTYCTQMLQRQVQRNCLPL